MFLMVDDEDVLECSVTADVKVVVQIESEYNRYLIEHPIQQLKNGKKMKIVVSGKGVISLKKAEEDDSFCYASYFLKMYLILMCIKDAISEGDIVRVNCLLKFMIPFFYAHSPLSKYFVECIDYILKTEVLLPPLL